MSSPEVSVLMAVYNDERYVANAIESILGQTFADLEFVIINDASTDKTSEILTAYSEHDNRIQLYHNEQNLGLTKSLNKGLNLLKGKYVARMDSDDISMPNRIAKQVSILNKNLDIELASSNMDLIDEDGIVWHKPRRNATNHEIAWLLIFYNYLGGHSQIMFRRDTVLSIGGYDENFKYSQDHDLWIRLSHLGKIYILEDVLLQYRQQPNSVSSKHSGDQQMLSLTASQQAIQNLIKEPIDIHQVEILRNFWLKKLSDCGELSVIHELLSEILKAFQIDRQLQSNIKPLLNIKKMIAGHFFLITKKMIKRKQYVGAISSLVYIMSWYILRKPIRSSKNVKLLPHD